MNKQHRVIATNRTTTWQLGALLILSVGFLLPLLYWVISVRAYTGGTFIYPVDDAYIHLQVSSNLAEHGTWGLNKGEFASASSSPLYTIVLALLIRVFGNHSLLPLIVNSLTGLLLITIMMRWLFQRLKHPIWATLIGISLIFLTPLPVVALSGMEHTLQLLFTFLFIRAFDNWYNGLQQESTSRFPTELLLWSMAMVSTRYENFFLLLPVVLIMMWHGRWKPAVALLLVSAVPIIVFGLLSLYHGSYFVPNSLLVKTGAGQFSLSAIPSLINQIVVQKLSFAPTGITLLATQRLLLLVPLVLLIPDTHQRRSGLLWLLTALWAACLLHISLADTGKFYRYEAYLVFHIMLCSMVVLCWQRHVVRKQFFRWQQWALLVALCFCLFPLLLRSLAGFSKARQACINIFEQQFQMARFLRANPDLNVAAANDIGAIAYYSNAYILDLWGLGNIETAKSKKDQYWTADYLLQLSQQKNTRVVMIYDSWIGKSIPIQWVKVGRWQIFNNVVCGDDFVTFYALDNQSAILLRQKMETFKKQLPKTVLVSDSSNFFP